MKKMVNDNEIRNELEKSKKKFSMFIDGHEIWIAFPRATYEDIERYHKISTEDLIEEYTKYYFKVVIKEQFDVRDVQFLQLMTREIREFRGKIEQNKLDEAIEKIENRGGENETGISNN